MRTRWKTDCESLATTVRNSVTVEAERQQVSTKVEVVECVRERERSHEGQG